MILLMMHKRVVIAFFSIFLCLFVLQPFRIMASDKVPNKTGKPKLVSQIDTILSDSSLSPCFLGVNIVSLPRGTVLYSRNSKKLFHPASTMKLVTTASALNSLSKNFRFITTVSTNAKIEDSLLAGNLHVSSSGDPLFTTADMDTIADFLLRGGIRTIKGNLIGDTSIFDGKYWGKGWMWDDEPEAYEAFISPLAVNANSLTFLLSPGRKNGDQISYTVDPPVPFLTVTNQGVTTDDTTIAKVTVTRPYHENKFLITGRLSPRDSTKKISLSLWQPSWFYLRLLKERLKERGITILGSCILDSGRHGKKLIEIIHPLDSVLSRINKESDNLAAEMLLKILGRERYGNPGTSEKGLLVNQATLLHCGIDTSSVTMVDGSGLSFYNEMTPDAFTRLLKFQFRQPTFLRYYESLPIAGIDGTLKKRMKGTKAEGNVHAKTGSFTGVSTLSGYVTSADSVLFAFSIMANHFPGDMRTLRMMQDKLMILLSEATIKK